MNPEHHIEPPETFFLPARTGYRFCLFHRPRPQSKPRGCVLYVHPFGEEMNKARRMASMQARRLAAAGIGVLQLDLLGCGDSSGTLEDASWEAWKEDLELGLRWLAQRDPGPSRLWGLRLGALLALDCVLTGAPQVHELLLWQPVISGEQFLTQFLRLSIAAKLLNSGAAAGTAELRRELDQGRTLEIGGYGLSARLAQAVDRLRLADLAPVGRVVDLLEVTSAPQAQPNPALSRALTTWRDRGCDVSYRAVPGEPFWTTVEIAECGALLDASVAVAEERWTNSTPSAR